MLGGYDRMSFIGIVGLGEALAALRYIILAAAE